MTLSTLVSDSSIPNFKNIRKAIINECTLSKKYSLLEQTTYFYEEGQEKTAELAKADIHDRIVVMNISTLNVSTTQPVLNINNWPAMIKYGEGAKWEPIGQKEHWYSTTRYPETPTAISQSTFYANFWFSASGTKNQLNQFGRDIVNYDPLTDSFKTKTLNDWDGLSVVNNTILVPGCVEELFNVEEFSNITIQSRYPTLVVPPELLLVFDDGVDKFVLVGNEVYRAWNTTGTYIIGFRGAFQAITQSQFDAHKVTIA